MFGKSCLLIGGSVLIREVDFRMFGKSYLIIGGSVDPPIIRQLLPNIIKSTPLIRTDPPIIRQLLPNIPKFTPLIRTDPLVAL
jgi:hypothetical protein